MMGQLTITEKQDGHLEFEATDIDLNTSTKGLAQYAASIMKIDKSIVETVFDRAVLRLLKMKPRFPDIICNEIFSEEGMIEIIDDRDPPW